MRAVITCLILLLLLPLTVMAEEEAVLRAVVNGQEMGSFFVTITDQGDILIERADLERLGFRKETAFREKDGRVGLSSIEGMDFEIDRRTATLKITADPLLLRHHSRSFREERPFRAVYLRDNALAFNYSLGLHHDDTGTSSSGNIEAIARYGLPLFYSSFSYSKEPDGGVRFHRLLTNITIDRPSDMHRLVTGDFSATSGGMGSGGTYGGVKFEKTFSLRPYLIRYPGISVEGVLDSPSTVEVYVNNSLVRSISLPPGEFSLNDLTPYAGSGEVKLLIRDAFGRERTMRMPFYMPSDLLMPGLYEYSLALGLRRESQGVKDFDYGKLSFIGFYRRGLTPNLTASLRAEADGDVQNMGSGINTTILNRAGLDLEIRGSHSGEGWGLGGSATLNLPLLRWLSLGMTTRGFTRHYSDLSGIDPDRRPALQASLNINIGMMRMGNLSVTSSMTDHYESEDIREVSLYYSRPIPGGSFYINAKRRWEGEKREDSLFAGIIITLGGGHGVTATHGIQDDRQNTQVSFYRNTPLGPGLGYRLQVNRESDGGVDWSGYGRLDYHSRYANLSADYQRQETGDSFNATVAGSVVINRGIHPGRPVRQGYALVSTGIKGIRVSLNGQEMGSTDRKGNLLVTELIPYAENTIRASAKDLPIGYRLLRSEQVVSPYYLSGALVELPAKALRAVEGSIYRYEHGRRVPVEYARLEVEAGGRKIETITGMKGVFYLEDIPAGRYTMRLTDGQTTCRAELEVPDGEDVIIEAGEVECR